MKSKINRVLKAKSVNLTVNSDKCQQLVRFYVILLKEVMTK